MLEGGASESPAPGDAGGGDLSLVERTLGAAVAAMESDVVGLGAAPEGDARVALGLVRDARAMVGALAAADARGGGGGVARAARAAAAPPTPPTRPLCTPALRWTFRAGRLVGDTRGGERLRSFAFAPPPRRGRPPRAADDGARRARRALLTGRPSP